MSKRDEKWPKIAKDLKHLKVVQYKVNFALYRKFGYLPPQKRNFQLYQGLNLPHIKGFTQKSLKLVEFNKKTLKSTCQTIKDGKNIKRYI